MAVSICDAAVLGWRGRHSCSTHGWHPCSTFNCECHSHAASDTKTGEASFCVAADHLMQQGHQDSAAGGSDRMTNGDGPAVDIDLRGIPSHLTVDPDCLRGKRLVDLHEVEIPMRPARL